MYNDLLASTLLQDMILIKHGLRWTKSNQSSRFEILVLSTKDQTVSVNECHKIPLNSDPARVLRINQH
jgi:hypothetical protein